LRTPHSTSPGRTNAGCNFMGSHDLLEARKEDKEIPVTQKWAISRARLLEVEVV